MTCSELVKALQSVEKVEAEEAEARLIELGNPCVDLLLPLLKNPTPEVRFRAVWILGKSRQTPAFDGICSLLSDPDERVQYDAAYALGILGDRRALPILWQIVRKKHGTSVSFGAMSGLNELGIVFLDVSNC